MSLDVSSLEGVTPESLWDVVDRDVDARKVWVTTKCRGAEFVAANHRRHKKRITFESYEIDFTIHNARKQPCYMWPSGIIEKLVFMIPRDVAIKLRDQHVTVIVSTKYLSGYSPNYTDSDLSISTPEQALQVLWGSMIAPYGCYRIVSSDCIGIKFLYGCIAREVYGVSFEDLQPISNYYKIHNKWIDLLVLLYRLEKLIIINKEAPAQALTAHTCMVCKNKPVSRVNVPCGHACMCNSCAKTHSNNGCYVCRTKCYDIALYLP